MSFLPTDSFLGNLELLEVYVFYDSPRLFACQNLSGQIFIAVWIDETANADIWLYVSVSPNRFLAIRSGYIDLHEAYAKAEEIDGLYKVTTYHDDKASCEPFRCEFLRNEWLPERGQRLSDVTETSKERQTEDCRVAL
jgi:hypothetical protein